MDTPVTIVGYQVVLHRALVEPILLGGAPRGVAIVNATFAGALGLGLQQWAAGLAIGLVGHSLAALAARRDPLFAAVLLRHLRQRAWLSC